VPTPPNFSTPYRVIREAMRSAVILGEGQEPNSEQFAECLPKFNDLVNAWQTQGLKLWLQFDLPVPLTANQALYSLRPGGNVSMVKPTRVIQGYYLDAFNSRRPIYPISRDEYTRLSTTVQTGQISSYFIDKLYDRLDVYFWLTPDADAATGIAHCIIQQQQPNVVALTDTMQIPQEWFLALQWGLADEICTGQPQAIMDRCAQRANTYRSALEAWDVEDASTTFTPDQRTTFGSQFR
jgi:hypothetical protein